jgi:hypothetical protein
MPSSNQKEVIDTRILRLIGLEDVFDLDYETYLTLLKEAMVKGRMTKTSIPTEEVELLTNEYKRVKTKKDKGRFEVKGKKITAGSFSVGQVKAKLSGTKPKGLLPTAIGKSPIASSLTESIAAITSAVTSIAETLKEQKTLTDDATAFDKRKSEQDKRALAESKLEKRFDGLKKAAEKIIAPVKSLLDKVLEFFTTILLGRVVYKLIEWLGNPENANKVKTIGRFLGDHWPKLLALYLTFGTSFGRFALGLTKAVAKGAVKLAFAIAKLLAAKKVKGAMGAARFLGGGKGKLLANVLGTGAAVGGSYALTQGLKGGEEEPKTQKYSGGGLAVPRFSGGGLNFKGMLGGASMGAMFGPLGMLLGGALGSGKPQEMVGGFVSGEKGVDKVPAMLSDGEFVMSAGAVRKYGVDTLEGMNAAGGGTNKPKVVSGTTYADGGGPIGENPDPNYKDPALSGRLDLMKSLQKYSNLQITGGGDKNLISALNNLSGVLSGQVNAPKSGGGVTGSLMRMLSKSPTSERGGGGSGGFSAARGYLGRVGNEIKKKADPVIKDVLGFRPDLSGMQGIISNAQGASTEAVPALLSSILGISGTDKSISQDMQKALLQAKKTAKERGRDYVDYKDYVGGGLSAGGLTMGRIGDKEWKRDDQGRIIGLRQVYDTNRSSGEAWDQGMQGWGQFFKSGLKDTSALGRGIYKPFEALLAATQHRGTTMHDVNFDEKVLGFKPGKEVLNDTQRGMIAGQKNREALQNKRPWWDKMGMFGGGSRVVQEQAKKAQISKSKPKNKRGVKPPTSAKPRVMYGPPAPQRRNVRGGRTTTSTPSFNATTRGSSAKQQTLGLVG